MGPIAPIAGTIMNKHDNLPVVSRLSTNPPSVGRNRNGTGIGVNRSIADVPGVCVESR
jgi:hypothetical protein